MTWKNNKIIIYPTVFFFLRPVSPSGRRQWCAIGVLVAVMIVVLILLFALWCRRTLTSDDVHPVTLNGQIKMEDVCPVSPSVTPFTHSKEKAPLPFNESNKWSVCRGGFLSAAELTLRGLWYYFILVYCSDCWKLVCDGDGGKGLNTSLVNGAIFEFNSDQWLKSLGFEFTPTEYSILNRLERVSFHSRCLYQPVYETWSMAVVLGEKCFFFSPTF